jgi:cholesterol oxidase
MLGVVRYPYMPTDVDRYMHQVATEMGKGETFNKAPVGIYFGRPSVDAEDPYFGGLGPRRTGCIGCGNCQVGCGHNAKNKVTTNYLYLAEKLGVEVHELHEVTTSCSSRKAGSKYMCVIPVGRSEPRTCTIIRTQPSR